MQSLIFAALGLYLLYRLQLHIYRKHWNRNLTVTMSFSHPAIIEDGEASLIEVVRNAKRLWLPCLTVKFQTSRNIHFIHNENSAITDLYYRSDIFSLKGMQQITRTLPFISRKRGYYTVTQIALSCQDLLMMEMYSEICEHFAWLYVYPRYVDMTRLYVPFNQLYGELLARRRIFEDPFEFRTIREYQPFDPMKAVNWKAYAKTGELKVNTFEDTASQEVFIIINLENHGYENHYDILEENIRLAATLTDMFISKGIPVALFSNGCDIIDKAPVYVNAGTSPGHLTTILQCLSRIDLNLPIAHLSHMIDGAFKDRTVKPFSIFISNYVQDDFLDALLPAFSDDANSWLIHTYHRQAVTEFGAPIAAKTLYWEVEHID